MDRFADVSSYIFDLDNTLYPAECNLFSQIDARMTGFIERMLDLDPVAARKLQKDLYRDHGTTLSGLMKEHDIDPQDFMAYVHDIDLTHLAPNDDLRAAICALDGRHYIFTNGSVKHAENVAGKLGILDLFDGIFDVSHADYTPKPHAPAYQAFLKKFDITPARAAMFEDIPDNLKVPHALGLTTVLVQSDADWLADEPEEKRPARRGEAFDHVHHVTDCLTTFLGQLAPAPEQADRTKL